MGLLSRAQEIFGKKIFREDVEFKGRIITRRNQEVYATPVAGEPSWGTPHSHKETLLSVDPTGTGDTTITVTNAPAGAKGIFGYAGLAASTGGRYLLIKDADAVAWGQVTVSVANIAAWSMFMIPLNANKQFKVAVNNADVTSVVIYMNGYFI